MSNVVYMYVYIYVYNIRHDGDKQNEKHQHPSIGELSVSLIICILKLQDYILFNFLRGFN
jgi:hypothetical protein